MHSLLHAPLYIHVPFCHRVCPYCAFFKHTPGATDMRGFVRAVVKEAQLRLPSGYTPRTIYFGGGTPSMLSPRHLADLVSGLRQHIDTAQAVEWSFEANPATFTPAKAAQWRELGITRISLGAQSFEPHLLRILGREHTPEQIAHSVRLLRAAGIPQVSLDLMFCLPGQSVKDWRHSLQAAVDLAPDHISTYSLTLEPGTPYAAAYPAPDEDTEVALYTLAHELLTSADYAHYEVSNYARTRAARSQHNLAYWRGESYYGLGPGACGTIGHTRYTNAPDTTAYISALLADHLPPAEVEELTPADRLIEQIGLRLRMDEGLPLSLIPPRREDTLRALCDEGLATLSPTGMLTLTPRGLLLADEISTALL